MKIIQGINLDPCRRVYQMAPFKSVNRPLVVDRKLDLYVTSQIVFGKPYPSGWVDYPVGL